LWEKSIGSLDNYTGVGWTGQPAIVCWPEDIRQIMNIVPEKKDKTALKEVIYAAMDGKIYFYDLDDGVATRDPIDIGFPIKGSVTIHPNGYPFMLVGQGVSILSSVKGSIGVHGINLIDQSQMFLITGTVKEANESSGAFDASPLIDPKTNTMIQTGENGLFYTTDLGLSIDMANQTLSAAPESVMYRFQAGSRRTGIEASPAVYGQYAYFADVSGILQCVDMKTMSPAWAVDMEDNTDATIALEVETDGRVALYTGNTLLNRKTDSDVSIRRLNALTGEEEWKFTIRCSFNSQVTGGVVASPVVGKGALDDLVFFMISRTSDGGTLVALNKQTGEVEWRVSTKSYGWSSPVAVYNEDGNGWILQANSQGVLTMYEGRTGREIANIELEGNIEGSPAVYGDILVVGTRDKKIYGIKIQ
jgi:outer membrane protein assembly factor BamB